MDDLKGFFNKTDNLFNWNLSDVQVSVPMVVKLKDKIEEKDAIDDATSDDKWPLKLTYGYELFTENAVEAEKFVDEAIAEIKTSKEYLNVKYRIPFLHIALSTKACMVISSATRLEEAKTLSTAIKPVSAMNNEETSGLLAMKAQIFQYYGPECMDRCIDWMKAAIRKNPKEPEWKISLVIKFNRKRHFFKGTETKWEDIEESVNILEEVLSWPSLTVKQDVMCKYYLAVAYHDYTMGKPHSGEISKCRQEILELCNGFYNKTQHPQYVSFCAERFHQSKGPDQRKGMELIGKFLDKFPHHIFVRTTAAKMYKRQQDYAKAAHHAKIAMDLGGYGPAWLYLECVTKMNQKIDAEEFFNNLLFQFQDMFKKQTHLNASTYYFFARQDPVNGARHFEQAIIDDPNYDLLRKPNYSPYVNGKFIPMEVAYNQIVLSLRTHHSREDMGTLISTKRRIEQMCPTSTRKYCTSVDLVQKAINEARRPKPRHNRDSARHSHERNNR